MNQNRIDLLEHYISEEPDNAFNKYALAMEYFDEAPEKSAEVLDLLLSEHPDYLPSYYKAAHLQWDAFENMEGAKEIFEKGIELAKEVKDEKAIGELKASYQNLLFEMD